MAENYWHIKSCELFQQVNDDDLAWLEARSTTKSFKRGEAIFVPDDQSDGILLVTSGRVKICHTTPEGKQSILGFVDAGEVFGELALLDNGARTHTAKAGEKTQLVLIPRVELLSIVQKYPSIVLGVTKLIGLRRQRVERRLRNLLFHSNRDRLIHLLLELSEKYGHRQPEGVHLKIRLSHQEMASIIGSTRETVTVVLGQLQSESLLKISRRRIVLLSLDRLANEVGEPVPMIKPAVLQRPHHLMA